MKEAPDFGTIANDWLNAATATCGTAEAASLRSVTRRIVQQLGRLRAHEIDSDAIGVYVRLLVNAGLKPKNHLRVLRRILGHAVLGAASIQCAVKEGIEIAGLMSKRVAFEFNGRIVTVDKNLDAETVIRDWWQSVYGETPEESFKKR